MGQFWRAPTPQGIETLGMRMFRHVSNALAVAEFLEGHKDVAWVKFPGLKSSPYHGLMKKYMPKDAGAVFSFGVKGGYEAGRELIGKLKVFSHLASVGDARSLVIQTHQPLSEGEQAAAGVTPDMVRLSVGLEDVEDLIWDLDQALTQRTRDSSLSRGALCKLSGVIFARYLAQSVQCMGAYVGRMRTHGLVQQL